MSSYKINLKLPVSGKFDFNDKSVSTLSRKSSDKHTPTVYKTQSDQNFEESPKNSQSKKIQSAKRLKETLQNTTLKLKSYSSLTNLTDFNHNETHSSEILKLKRQIYVLQLEK